MDRPGGEEELLALLLRRLLTRLLLLLPTGRRGVQVQAVPKREHSPQTLEGHNGGVLRQSRVVDELQASQCDNDAAELQDPVHGISPAIVCPFPDRGCQKSERLNIPET